MHKILLPFVFAASLLSCGGGGGTSPAVPGGAGPLAASISAVQGAGDVSPMEGQRVRVEGVVTGDFQNGDADASRNLGGFYLQSLASDNDPATSDGIFVFDQNSSTVNVVLGQSVDVTGTVIEHFGETQIVVETVNVTGFSSIQPTELLLPANTILNSDGESIVNLERFEGMFVSLAAPPYVSEVFNLQRYGELTLSEGDRLRQFTNSAAPDIAGYAANKEEAATRSLILDDGLSIENPDSFRFLRPAASNSANYSLRIGDTVAVAIGNIRFSRGSGASGKEAFRLEPAIDPLFVSRNPASVVPPDVGGSVRVASFNVLNYFTTIDNGQSICGPAGDMGCRGADSDLEFDRQHDKTVNALLALDADVVGLMELENNGGPAVQNIVSAMNGLAGNQSWAFIDTGIIGTDAIAVGIIYRSTAVQPAGAFAVLTSSTDARFNDQRNRPVLAQSFDAVGGGRFTVAVNHLKSKGSPCDDLGDPNLGDGQGNCNQTRQSAASALAEWLSNDPTSSGDADVLIIGDFNAYLQEDPITAIEIEGYVNLLESRIGTEAYSFVFDGRAGALDHAFASVSLQGRVTGVGEWHINADEPPLFDYNLELNRDPGLFDASSPFRSSDHDPIIVGIDP